MMPQFQKGNKYGKGRPPSGRTQALNVLDEILGEEENKEKLRRSLQGRFNDDPAKFFDDFVKPLLPKNLELSGLDGEPIQSELTVNLSKLSDADLRKLRNIKQNLISE